MIAADFETNFETSQTIEKSDYKTLSFQSFKEEILRDYHKDIEDLQLNKKQTEGFLLQLYVFSDMISNELLLLNPPKK